MLPVGHWDEGGIPASLEVSLSYLLQVLESGRLVGCVILSAEAGPAGFGEWTPSGAGCSGVLALSGGHGEGLCPLVLVCYWCVRRGLGGPAGPPDGL